MGISTGRPRGRPRGSKNKRALEMAARTAELAAVIEPMLGDAFEGDAHAYLMSVYKDKTATRAERLDASGKAIRYEKPALAAIDVTSTNEHVIRDVGAEPLRPDEWVTKHATH